MKGLRAGWRHEASFRLEVYLVVILFPLGLWLGHGADRKGDAVRMSAVGACRRTAEFRARGRRRPGLPGIPRMAGRAKDMGSAAVFVPCSTCC